MKNLILIFLLIISYSVFAQNKTEVTNTVVNQSLNNKIEQLLDSTNYYYFKGNYIKSLKLNINVIDKAIQANKPKQITRGYRYLGYTYLVMNDTLLARESFENAKKYAESDKNDLAVGLSYMDLANLYSSAYKDYETALKYHDKSLFMIRKANDSTELIKALNNTILSIFDAEDYPTSYKYLKELSLPVFAKFQNESVSAGLLNFWGNYHNSQGHYAAAEPYAIEAIELSKQSELPVELADAYQILSKSYEGQKKYKESLAYRNKYIDQYKNNVEMQQDSESEAISAKFQVQQYQDAIVNEKEKTQLQAQIVNNKNKLNKTLIFICISGIILFIGLYYVLRKRRELNKALAIKNEEYLKAKQESEHLAKMKSQFFSTVSHELRTPLYGVIGLSTLLLEDEKLQDHEKDLKSLKFSADYLLALINDVLQISKIDANNFEDEETKPFNVRETLRKIISSFEYMRLQNKNEISLSIDKDVPQVLKGNTTRLYQILMNLIGNAYKFTEDGYIHIDLSTVSKTNTTARILFAISDTGIGMPEQKLKTIFDEFTQIENLDYSYQGTGLGLPIVKKLINLLKSEIYVKSELGKGTTFSFELDYEISNEVVTSKEKLSVDDITLKDKKILIAEDNRINQIVTRKILEKKGVLCKIVDNGKEAIEAAENDTYNLILMDINMPIKDGFEAAKEIRDNNIKTPIVALTAVEMTEVRNKVYQIGMNDIIVKPYDVDKFIRTIIKNLDQHQLGESKKVV